MFNKKNNKKHKNIINAINQFDITRSLQQAGNAPQVRKFDTLNDNSPVNLIGVNQVSVGNYYTKHGIIRNIIDVPVDDAFRGGIDIVCNTKEVEESEIEEFEYFFNHEIIDKTNGWTYVDIAREAARYRSLWGGAGVVIDDGDDYYTEFKNTNIQKDQHIELYVANPFELNMTTQSQYAEHKPYTEDVLHSEHSYFFYGKKIHNTRVIKTNNNRLVPLLRPVMRGWGMCGLEHLITPLNEKIKSENVLFTLLDEALITFYQIKELADSVQTEDGRQALRNFLADVVAAKNYSNMLISDTESNLQQIQPDLNGIANVYEKIIVLMLGIESGIPIGKLTGQFSGGIGGGASEIELENYYNKVEGCVRRPMSGIVRELMNIASMQYFGFIPQKLRFNWFPLKSLTEEQKQNSMNAEFNRINTLLNSKLLKPKKAAEMINRAKLLPMEIDLNDVPDDFEDLNLGDNTNVPQETNLKVNPINTNTLLNKIKKIIGR